MAVLPALVSIDTSQAVFYHDGKFPPPTLDHVRILPALLAATDALARYDQMLASLPNSEVFLAPLRNQEAVISSRMEGTISTLDEILQLEADYPGDLETEPEFRSEAVETLLYQIALRTAQKQMADGRPLTTSLIKSIHQQMMRWGRGASKSPGAFRTDQNYIGERGSRHVRFVPVAPEHLESGMEALLSMVTNPSLPVLVRTALCHVEFEALHPFQDGNGRVGRMMITLMLWSQGAISAPHFYISRYFEEHKADYIETMRNVSATGDWEAWVILFLEALTAQARQNLRVAREIQACYEEMKVTFADLLSSRYAVAALDYCFAKPVFLNSRFTRDAGIPAQTAARFSRLLLKAGLLQTVEEPAGRRSAVYRFEPLLEKVRV